MNRQLMCKSALPFLIVTIFLSCKTPVSKPSPAAPTFERILQDTAHNRRAQLDLLTLAHYNNICKAIGLNRLYDGVDSFEVRTWRQFSYFGLSVDEEIYSLKLVDTTVHLTYYRVYCKPYDYDNENYRKWDAFTDPEIDSFVAVSKTFSTKIIDSINLLDLWSLKTQSALHIPDSIGYTDGAVTSIELASNTRYKLIRYHEALAYYQDTKTDEIGRYLDTYNKLIALFQAKKVYARF